MSDDKLDDLLGAWRRSVVPLEDTETEQERRARVVPKLARNIREQAAAAKRSRSRRQVVAAVLAVAALIAVFFGARALLQPNTQPTAVAHLSGDVVVTHAGKAQALSAARDHDTHVGDAFSTLAHKSAILSLSSGAEVHISGSSQVALIEAAPTRTGIRVDAGEVRVKVPKLAPGGRFEVVTPDTLVTVHGTEFTVRVAASGTTTVIVHEGEVSTKSRGKTAVLSPGEDATWTSSGDTAPTPTTPAQAKAAKPPEVATAPAKPEAPGTKPHQAPAATDRPPSTPETSLAAQNKVYAAALAARDKGNDSQAIALLDELLRRYPGSPLAPEARLERFRALKRMGKSQEASSEARRYLRVAPGGAARDEARDVAMPKR